MVCAMSHAAADISVLKQHYPSTHEWITPLGADPFFVGLEDDVKGLFEEEYSNKLIELLPHLTEFGFPEPAATALQDSLKSKRTSDWIIATVQHEKEYKAMVSGGTSSGGSTSIIQIKGPLVFKVTGTTEAKVFRFVYRDVATLVETTVDVFVECGNPAFNTAPFENQPQPVIDARPVKQPDFGVSPLPVPRTRPRAVDTIGPAVGDSGEKVNEGRVWALGHSFLLHDLDGYKLVGVDPVIEGGALVYENTLFSTLNNNLTVTYLGMAGFRYKHQTGEESFLNRFGIQIDTRIRSIIYLGSNALVQGGVQGVFLGGRALSELGLDAGFQVHYGGIWASGDVIWNHAYDEQIYRNFPRLRVGIKIVDRLKSLGVIKPNALAGRWSLQHQGTRLIIGVQALYEDLTDFRKGWHATGRPDPGHIFAIGNWGKIGFEVSFGRQRYQFYKPIQGSDTEGDDQLFADNTLPQLVIGSWWSEDISWKRIKKIFGNHETTERSGSHD